MKRVFAILLFSVHLFNLAGYTLLFRYLQQKNTKQTLLYIQGRHYSDQDLVLVKIPVLLPYASNWGDYEPYSGEIEWGGVHYNYVKRKILNDTLYLLCLPDMKRTRLVDAHERYAREVNEHGSYPQKSKNRASNTVILTGEYTEAQTVFALTKIEALAAIGHIDYSASLAHVDSDCVIQPPDAIIG